MISYYLMDIMILLVAAVIAVPTFQALRLGAVPGFVLSGVLVGPAGLGWITNIDEIKHLAEIGVVLLLFVIGVELKPSRLWLMRRLVFGLGSLQILIAGFILGAGFHFFFGIPLRVATLVGPALALSSTAFVLQLLAEQKLLGTSYGRASLSVLLMQDLAVVPLLALVPLLVLPEMSISEDIGFALLESLVILALIVVIGRYLLHPVLHRVALSGNAEVFTASAVLIVLGTALLAEHIGLSMAMGAFLAGLLISDSFYRHQVIAEIHPFRGLLLGLFFMSMGMSLNLNLLMSEPILSVSLVFGLLLIKIIVLFPLAFLFGVKLNAALAVALVLAQSGEFALVLFSLAYDADLLTDAQFQQLLMIVLLSMLATPPLSRMARRIYRHKGELIDAMTDEQQHDVAPVVIAGFGRVGRRVGDILAMADVPYVALDYNAGIVDTQRKHGYRVYYGDVCKPEVLKAAGADSASIIIVTLDNPEGAEEVVDSLRKSYPEVDIYVRGTDLEQCQRLRDFGATGAVSENLEASLELARKTLADIGIDPHRRDKILTNFRRVYHEQMGDQD